MWDAVPSNLREDIFSVLQGGDDGLNKSSLGFYCVKIFFKKNCNRLRVKSCIQDYIGKYANL